MCNLDKDLLQRYMDKDIDPLEKILLENHLLSCPQCRRDLNHLKIMEWDLNNIAIPKVPKELTAVRNAALDKYLKTIDENETSFEKKDIINLQYRNLKKTVSFINYLPGKKIVENAVRKAAAKSTRETKNKSLLSKIIGL